MFMVIFHSYVSLPEGTRPCRVTRGPFDLSFLSGKVLFKTRLGCVLNELANYHINCLI